MTETVDYFATLVWCCDQQVKYTSVGLIVNAYPGFSGRHNKDEDWAIDYLAFRAVDVDY